MTQSAVGIDRQLPKNITVSINYHQFARAARQSRGEHQFAAARYYTGLNTECFPYGYRRRKN